MKLPAEIQAFIRNDRGADRVVPRSGQSARLTFATSAAMAFLAVFAMALSMAAGRLADRWSDALAQSSTIRISASEAEIEAQTAAVLTLLAQTPGIETARLLTDEDQQALLAPWFGPDLPLDDLPVPQLVEITETRDGYDTEGLRQRLAAEAPGAVLDDHERWRRPLAEAAGRLRVLGALALILILGTTAAMVTLAAQSALSANEQVVRVLRLVGARDSYIARAFVRRFTIRAVTGAALGTIFGVIAVAILPSARDTASILTGLSFSGAGWLWPFVIPPLAAATAYTATRIAALRTLKGLQ
jgi:cell division transport system permease protein